MSDPGYLTAVADIDDVRRRFADHDAVADGLKRGTTIVLTGRARAVAVGREVPIKVNTNIGISHFTPYAMEKGKLDRLAGLSYGPDLMMDHTIDPKVRDFWRHMVATFDGPVGTLPQYTAYEPRSGLSPSLLVERIEEMLEGGVAFMTMHFTSDLDIYELAKASRPIPVTSRGGGLAIRDMLKWPKEENAFRVAYDEIAALFAKHGAAISVGTTFRPADVHSALDRAHVLETERQIETVHDLRSRGVKVMMEGVGHMPLDRIEEYSSMVAEAQCPFMPLGPMVTDSAIGYDHVVNAIGGAYMGLVGGAQVINSVTREEHTGGVPTEESVIEGLMSARVAAHAVNVARFPGVARLDLLAIKQRGEQVSCVVSGGLFDFQIEDTKKGCTRCDFECPIILAPAGLRS